ncbi:MAG: DUF5320 domain-containing protein [Anaerolineae bacterium]|nr:DUF5320 domain-containing protein [Anaerolineae bacterium]
MPARDHSGPMGEGPMTGRGLGDCSGAPQTGGGWFPRARRFWRAGLGGRRFGFGRGWGMRGGFGNPAAAGETKETLRQRKQWLEQELKDIDESLKD